MVVPTTDDALSNALNRVYYGEFVQQGPHIRVAPNHYAVTLFGNLNMLRYMVFEVQKEVRPLGLDVPGGILSPVVHDGAFTHVLILQMEPGHVTHPIITYRDYREETNGPR